MIKMECIISVIIIIIIIILKYIKNQLKQIYV